MKEAAFWNTVRLNLRDRYILDRVENGVSAGMPDVHFQQRVTGLSGWVELKSIPAYPKRAETRVLGLRGLSKDQKTWLHRAWRHLGHAWILVRVDADKYLVPGCYAFEVNEWSVGELSKFKCRGWSFTLIRGPEHAGLDRPLPIPDFEG